MSKLIKTLGRKWTLEILHLLSSQDEVRYSKIEEIVSNPRTSSRRLNELAELRLIDRIVSEDRTVSYKLTTKGRELVKLVDKIIGLE